MSPDGGRQRPSGEGGEPTFGYLPGLVIGDDRSGCAGRHCRVSKRAQSLLIGLRGQLFIVGADLNVVRSAGLSCIGAGRHHGYGAMHALKAAGIAPAQKRIEIALQAAANYSLYVRPPFRILETA